MMGLEYSRKRRKVSHVPLTIDLEGNEQNISQVRGSRSQISQKLILTYVQSRGNAPDMTMRPSRSENVPVIRTLNTISLQILNLVAPPAAAYVSFRRN
jgi:transcription initiation factor TFIIH subunit 1